MSEFSSTCEIFAQTAYLSFRTFDLIKYNGTPRNFLQRAGIFINMLQKLTGEIFILCGGGRFNGPVVVNQRSSFIHFLFSYISL